MNIRTKPEEVIHAQIAAFASEQYDAGKGNEQANDQAHLLSNIGFLASAGVVETTRVTQDNEYIDGELIYSAGFEKPVATKDQYVDFLRSVGGSRHETIANRADMLGAYGQFKPSVDQIKDATKYWSARKNHPAYIANGSNSYVYQIEGDSGGYAARIPNNPKASIVDGYIKGAVLGRGIPHLEQVVAVSYEDGVTISEIMPGKPLDKHMSSEDIGRITDDHLAQFVDTVVAADKKGIKIDPKPDNFLYDPDEGFGVIDYSANRLGHVQVRLGEQVGEVGQSFMQMGFFGRTAEECPRSAEDYARDLKLLNADISVLSRYKTIVTNRLEGEDLNLALARINKDLETWRTRVENYSNPEWVSKEISGENEIEQSWVDPLEVW